MNCGGAFSPRHPLSTMGAMGAFVQDGRTRRVNFRFQKIKKNIQKDLQDRQVYQKTIRTSSSVSFVFLA
jgi:hypothetical protein